MHSESTDGSVLETGTVMRKGRGLYEVRAGDTMVQCSISNRLRKRLFYPTSDPASGTHRGVQKVADIKLVDPVAIGDEVRFAPAEDGHGQIRDVMPRRNELSRRVVDPKRRGDGKDLRQVVVANVDQVVPVIAAAKPRPTWHLLDRYLVGAEAAGIPALICVTKMDLARGDDIERRCRVYERIGYHVAVTSAVTGVGVGELLQSLAGRISVFVGKSGVGKTSLLNGIQPDLGLRVREVSAASGKGRHTTSHLEMFPLDAGGGVVDTPGMKVFAPLEDPAEIAACFPEMRPYLGRCRFGSDCSHSHEPGCAIKEAVEAGEIDGERYRSFLKM